MEKSSKQTHMRHFDRAYYGVSRLYEGLQNLTVFVQNALAAYEYVTITKNFNRNNVASKAHQDFTEELLLLGWVHHNTHTAGLPGFANYE